MFGRLVKHRGNRSVVPSVSMVAFRDSYDVGSGYDEFFAGPGVARPHCRELLNVLERHGIRRVHPLNEPFNPHLHQAVMEIQRTDVPSGTIVQIFQAGFMIEDRVLRPAMVAVSKGGPKQAPPSEGAPGPSGAGPANEN